jgi:hypothetical protein
MKMTPVLKKRGTRASTGVPISQASGNVVPADDLEDYRKMLTPMTDDDRPEKEGRGPTPHYTGLIKAFLELDPEGVQELKIDVDQLRQKMKKPKLQVASIRQGLRNNLHSMGLWDDIQVSINKKGVLSLKRRESKPGRE